MAILASELIALENKQRLAQNCGHPQPMTTEEEDIFLEGWKQHNLHNYPTGQILRFHAQSDFEDDRDLRWE